MKFYKDRVETIKKNPMSDDEVEALYSLLKKFLGTEVDMGVNDEGVFDFSFPVVAQSRYDVNNFVEIGYGFLYQGDDCLILSANKADEELQKYFEEE